MYCMYGIHVWNFVVLMHMYFFRRVAIIVLFSISIVPLYNTVTLIFLSERNTYIECKRLEVYTPPPGVHQWIVQERKKVQGSCCKVCRLSFTWRGHVVMWKPLTQPRAPLATTGACSEGCWYRTFRFRNVSCRTDMIGRIRNCVSSIHSISICNNCFTSLKPSLHIF